MSDTVKIIIEISKDIYEARQRWVDNPKRMVDEVDIAIANGTLLDDIKAEIKNRSYGIANDSVIRGEMYERRAVLEIIDNIGKKSEDK